MSTNIHINSTGVVKTPNGSDKEIYKPFNCWQTPSKDTTWIMDQKDRLQAYKDWVMSRECIEMEDIHDIFTWDDETDYYKVIGQQPYSAAKEHIKDLEEFVETEESLGFNLNVVSW